MDLSPLTSARFDVRMVRRSAQRASRSPSQGRRPWWLPPPPRPAQRANRSTNRAGSERNGWPVGPALPLRPAAQPTPAGSQRVAGGRAQRPPPVHAPPRCQHPEGCARNRRFTRRSRFRVDSHRSFRGPPRASVPAGCVPKTAWRGLLRAGFRSLASCPSLLRIQPTHYLPESHRLMAICTCPRQQSIQVLHPVRRATHEFTRRRIHV
jgi:hypothetical protein